MSPERWQRLLSVFGEAIDREPDERDSYIKAQCGGDEELERAARQMISAHQADASFMSSPAIGASAASLDGNPSSLEEAGYRIVRKLGAGGMGVVYLAEQASTGRRVALKVVNPWLSSPATVRRFEYEVRALAQLHHPGIAQIYEAGAMPTPDGPCPYFAMEYIEGKPLLEYVGGRSLSKRQRLELFLKVCAAVQHAHQKGVIHRDLKPANIVVTDAGEPKILDFGVARMISAEANTPSLHTREGQMIGTLGYMSPEQVEGNPDEVDTRADVYALGVVLFELLAGRPPLSIAGLGVIEAARVIREEAPGRLSDADRSLRGDLDVIVGKALAKERDRRYASVAELAADVERFQRDEPIVARPSSAWYQTRKFARRNKVAVGLMAATMAALVFGVIGTGWQAYQANVARAKAIEGQERERVLLLQAQAGQLAAKEQAEASKSVLDFFVEVLSAADPANHGSDVKVLDLVQAADRRLEHELTSQEAWYAFRESLASLFLALNRYDDSERQIKLIQERASAESGVKRKYVHNAETLLGEVRRQQGRLEESASIQRRVIDARLAEQPGTTRELVLSMNALGATLIELGRLKEAEATLRDAAAKAEAEWGQDDRLALQVTLEHGDCLIRLGRRTEAISLISRAAAACERVAGANAPLTLRACMALGMAHASFGDYEKAELLYRRVLTGSLRSYGERSPEALIAMSNLAGTLMRLRKLPEALELSERAVLLCKEFHGALHPNTLNAQAKHALILSKLGRYDESVALNEQLLTAQEQVLGSGHQTTLSTMHNLAHDYMTLERPDDAMRMIDRTIELRTASLGPTHPQTLGSRGVRARFLEQTKCVSEAEKDFTELIELASQKLGPTDKLVTDFRSIHARCLAKLGRWEEAETELLDVHRALEGAVSASDPRWFDIHKVLVSFYEAWGKPDKAAQFRLANGKVTPSAGEGEP